ncbi:MAG TPA: glycosyltransferase family 2 protein [Chthoniobacterales bacterium]|nr:glycosyltransferase family 2 protein [Chthoniobacterales bacterium]
MIWTAFAMVALLLAAVPCALFVANLRLYRVLSPAVQPNRGAVSVLIPARDEERNIAATIEAVLANRGVEFEVIVLDDDSTDATGQIVERFAKEDSRVRLEKAPSLPAGWCGKQHACHILAGLARHPLLVFLDADVRLAPDALSRTRTFVHESGAHLVSGVPRQELGTFSEHLLLPLIHFVLLGFLPLAIMRRRDSSPSCSAGCGQLLVAEREAYFASGGHGAFGNQMHDGLNLPRVFRRAGFRTDLFDATNVATCRMYRTDTDVWRGLSKNAFEGLAAPKTILPITVVLLGGQVLPFVLLAMANLLSPTARTISACATALVLLPRLLSISRFSQSFRSALLHPVGILALLAIQWHALARQVLGKPAEWKGRMYAAPKWKSV